EDGVDSEMLEEVAWHLVQLGLGWRRNHHAEVQRVSFKLGLHGEGLHLLDRVPGDEHLLRRLQNVRILCGEVAARRVRAGWQHYQGHGKGQHSLHRFTPEEGRTRMTR